MVWRVWGCGFFGCGGLWWRGLRVIPRVWLGGGGWAGCLGVVVGGVWWLMGGWWVGATVFLGWVMGR